MMKCTSPYTVIFGCGNTLLGDDGFGPAVIDALRSTTPLPDNIITIDAGTGIREHLLDFLLSPVSRPVRVIVVDAIDIPGLPPGTLQERDPSTIPAKKIHDFSLHQFPTVNLLRELATETTTLVTLLTVQIETIPNAVRPGLSPTVAAAVPAACKHLYHFILGLQDNVGGGA